MSHVELLRLWEEQRSLLEPFAVPPPLPLLEQLAAERIEQARSAARYLEPPTLAGYMMSLGDGHRTVADAIADVRWCEQQWRLAMACPDGRPPLYPALLALALGGQVWLPWAERAAVLRRYLDHKGPLAPLVRLVKQLTCSYDHHGHAYTEWRRLDLSQDLEAVRCWWAHCNTAELAALPEWYSYTSTLNVFYEVSMKQPFRSGATGLSLSTTWASAQLGELQGDATTEPLPSRGWMGGLDVALSSISGASSVQFYLSTDLAGAELLTPNNTTLATQTINPSLGGASAGGVSWDLVRKPFVGPIYVHLRLDAGTANATARLSGEADSSYRSVT